MATMLLAGVAMSTMLVACGEDDPLKEGPRVYTSYEACVKDLSPEECSAAQAAALESNTRTAPRYTSRQECETTYGAGACIVPHPAYGGPAAASSGSGGSGDWFVPALAGFMVGRMAGDMLETRPIYRDRQGYAYTGGAPMGFNLDDRSRRCVDPNTRTREDCGSRGGGGSFIYHGGYYSGPHYSSAGTTLAGSNARAATSSVGSVPSSVARVAPAPSTVSVTRGVIGGSAAAHASGGGT